MTDELSKLAKTLVSAVQEINGLQSKVNKLEAEKLEELCLIENLLSSSMLCVLYRGQEELSYDGSYGEDPRPFTKLRCGKLSGHLGECEPIEPFVALGSELRVLRHLERSRRRAAAEKREMEKGEDLT